MEQPLARSLGSNGPKQRLHDQLLRHAGIEGVT
jgi:hypothetical protein